MAIRARKTYIKELPADREKRRSQLTTISALEKDEQTKLSSIEMDQFYGNLTIHLKDELFQSPDTAFILQIDPLKLLDEMREVIRFVRIQKENYQTRAEIFHEICHDLATQVSHGYHSLFLDYLKVKEQLLIALSEVDRVENHDETEEDNAQNLERKEKLKLLEEIATSITNTNDKLIEEISEKKLNFAKVSKLISSKILEKVSEKVETVYKTFTSAYYKIFAKAFLGQDYTGENTPKQNLSINEFKLCRVIQLSKHIIDHILIPKLLQSASYLRETILEHKDFFETKIKKFNKIYSEVLQEENSDELHVDYSFLEMQLQESEFNNLIGQDHVKFIQKKIKHKRKTLLEVEDMDDFFKLYKFNWNSPSPLILSYCGCQIIQKKKESKSKSWDMRVVLDIFGSFILYQIVPNEKNIKAVIDDPDSVISVASSSIVFFRKLKNIGIEAVDEDSIKVNYFIDEGVVNEHLRNESFILKLDKPENLSTFVELIKTLKKANTHKTVHGHEKF